MSRDYFIRDSQGERRIDSDSLPLKLGGRDSSDIVLNAAAAEAIYAHIALSDGHAYIQAANDAPAIYLNDERLSGSAWLKSGDRIQIDAELIRWTVQGDKVMIDIEPAATEITPRPPNHPIPGTLPPIQNDLPLEKARTLSPPASKRFRRGIYALVGLLLLSAGWLLLASSVIIQIQPEPDSLEMQGFPPPLNLWGTRLALPGQYTLRASRSGYHPLHEQVQVQSGGTTRLNFQLSELPGQLEIIRAPVQDIEVKIDGIVTNASPSGLFEISRGQHQLEISAVRYLPQTLSIDIKGFGEQQTLNITLQAAWATLEIISDPEGAQFLVDDTPLGRTPLKQEILQGTHRLGLRLEGYKPLDTMQTVGAGDSLRLPIFKLQLLDGTLRLKSQPDAASVLLDGVFQGVTPIELALSANIEHRIELSKAGYSSRVETLTLKPEEQRPLKVALQSQYGSVFMMITPADAGLFIDGKKADKNSGRLRLSTRPHTLKISKPGYVSQSLQVTPRANVSQNINIQLKTKQQQQAQKKTTATPPVLVSAAKQKLILLKPAAAFKMGASRREAGRRANENQRLIQLKRPFYLAAKEVTNQQYSAFSTSHDSGKLDGAALNADGQPVVNISWDDAARYCNWLSQQDSLPVAYQEKNGKMQAVNPLNTGYRLPTEAEWAWVSRIYQQSSSQRYPWAGSYPPATVSGNYADASISDTLADTVPNYNDGYRGSAPVASFAARPAGFYDLGGNVSEWVHDYYALYPGQASQLVVDPAGPQSGEHHVVRGAGWRHGSITELRLSYRDYSKKPRADLGFRIARYAE